MDFVLLTNIMALQKQFFSLRRKLRDSYNAIESILKKECTLRKKQNPKPERQEKPTGKVI